MGALTFKNLQDEVAGRAGLDLNRSNQADRVKRWLNLGGADVQAVATQETRAGCGNGASP